jgi:hypothetical protein
MQKTDIDKELESPEYKAEFNRTVTMRESMIMCLLSCFMNANRDTESAKRNFTLRLLDDLIQCVTAMEYLAREGFTNTVKGNFAMFRPTSSIGKLYLTLTIIFNPFSLPGCYIN